MRMFSLESVAERLEVSARTVRRLIDRGELPFKRVLGSIRVPDEALEEYMRADWQQLAPKAKYSGAGVGHLRTHAANADAEALAKLRAGRLKGKKPIE